MADLILAVDVGTTNIKAGAVDESGNVLRLAQRELTVERDDEGKAEHDPAALFDAFAGVCREVSQGLKNRIALLVPSSYQLGILPIGPGGQPLMGIMTLLDTRPQETYPELLRKIDIHTLYQRTGCPSFFHYPFSKIFWLKARCPQIFEQTRYFLSSKDFLLMRLLGKPFTEASIAVATQMMNVHTLQWDDYPLEVLGVRPEQLPPPVASESVLDVLPEEARKLLGLTGEVGLLPGVYDGGAVGIGIGGMDDRVGVINIGTTAMLRVASDRATLDSQPAMRLQTYYLACGKWFPGAGINNAGVVLKWLRDNIFGLPYDALTAEAASVPDSGNLLFLPFLSGERNPQIGNTASGVFFGLRGFHRKGHLIRAAMEGVSFALRLVLEALQDNEVPMDQIRVGGGGARSQLWMEIMASALGAPLQITRVEETALLGSAMLGFVAMGRFRSLSEATRAMVRTDRLYHPNVQKALHYEKRYDFFKYLIHHFTEAFQRHSEIT